MRQALDNDRPLFLQIKELIEDAILTGELAPDDQIPSNSQLVSTYGVNPVTVHKGVSLLLDEGIIYKRRGIGMYVSREAPERIRTRYQKSFRAEYIEPLLERAVLLGISIEELGRMMGER
ncbi:MAG: GntR family transcriptional regulator [Coriobacteriales bacterium]|jgi:DNA-binding transcriptional regulator YhcF (GntR family)|nr:GntR family transcriptional regulator [Coriobacteriales bacterium]